MEFPELKRGGHPIIHLASQDDVSHMTVLELRYASRNRVVRVPGSTRSRFGRDVRGDRVINPPMTDSRMSKMEDLRARIERDDYTVDATKVADAIVARLLAGRSSKDAAEKH
jgi:anti-sigma-28 factor FlgM